MNESSSHGRGMFSKVHVEVINEIKGTMIKTIVVRNEKPSQLTTGAGAGTGAGTAVHRRDADAGTDTGTGTGTGITVRRGHKRADKTRTVRSLVGHRIAPLAAGTAIHRR